MDAISELINLLNDKDKLDFKAYLKKKNKRHDAKNIRLFDLLDTDDIKSINKLYQSSKNKDSYHALRKRLHENLLLFLSQRTFERNHLAVYELLRFLVIGRYLLENNLSKIGFKCLDRAERIAQQQEEYNLLQEILMLRLQFAHLEESLDLDALSNRFLLNQSHLLRESKMQLAYAFIRKELNEIQLKGKVIDLTKLIEETIRKYKIAVLDFMNYKSLYQILFIANEYAAINQNFGLVEKYIRKSYQYIHRELPETTAQQYYRLYILYYLANFSFRNRQFEESLQYLQQMTTLMGESKEYKDQFFLRQTLLFGLNYHFMGEPERGISMLQDALRMHSANAKLEDVYDLQVAVLMFQAQHGDRACLAGLAKLTHTDAWLEKKLGMLWAIRKMLLEILIYGDFGAMELATARIKSFRRRYRQYLIQTHELKVLDYVALLEKYFLNPETIYNKTYQSKVLSLMELAENRDLFNLSFIAWLMAKWEKRSAYAVTRDLLEGNPEHSPTKMT